MYFPQILTKAVPSEIIEFIYRVIPEKYRFVPDKINPYTKKREKSQQTKYITERGRLLINDEFLTPLKIIESDPLFSVFRRETK